MTKQEAVEILKNHNKWRKGEDVQPYSPSVLSEAIDTVTEAIVPNQSHTADVTDEEIEAMAEKVRNGIHANNCLCLDEIDDHIFDVGYHSGYKEALSRMPDGWVKCSDKLPEPFETVWISNGKGWTSLGCYVVSHGDSCWAETNGVMYEENGRIVAECESDDLDVQLWHSLPKSPTT